MTVTMSCSACGFVILAKSEQSASESYFAHAHAVHPPEYHPFNAPRTSIDALRKLVSLVQSRP
jgi:hypothetical protein